MSLLNGLDSVHVRNEAGVFGAKMGRVTVAKNGVEKTFDSVFSRRNPKTGDVFGEDIPTKDGVGMWVPYEEVEWL